MVSPELKENIDSMIDHITPEIYQRLVTAVELGKWADGNALTAEQKENTMQLVMLWQAKHNHDAQHMSLGFGGELVFKSKQQLKVQFTDDSSTSIQAENRTVNIIYTQQLDLNSQAGRE